MRREAGTSEPRLPRREVHLAFLATPALQHSTAAMKRPCQAPQLSVRSGSACSGESGAIVSMGDSFISGEGGRWAGNGDALNSGSALGTDRAATDCTLAAGTESCRYDLTKVYGGTSYQGGNGCDRSDVAEIKGADLYGIPPERRFNLACSGAETKHVRSEGHKGEAPQVQQLRELATRQNIKVIALSIGGNDLDFSGILTRCARRFMLGLGACHDGEDGPLKSKLAGLQGSVEGTVDDIRAVMRDAGVPGRRLHPGGSRPEWPPGTRSAPPTSTATARTTTSSWRTTAR